MFCGEKLWGKKVQQIQKLNFILFSEANTKGLFVLSCHSFPPTDAGIYVGEKEEFLCSAPLLPISLCSPFHSFQNFIQNKNLLAQM
jgi:hypothetical protein